MSTVPSTFARAPARPAAPAPAAAGFRLAAAALAVAAAFAVSPAHAQPTGGAPTQSQGATAPAPNAPKTMTLAIQTEPKGFLIDYTQETVRIGGIVGTVGSIAQQSAFGAFFIHGAAFQRASLPGLPVIVAIGRYRATSVT